MSDSLENFGYRLLGRLQQDCEYYLGAGNRHKKHLWALDETLQIQKMKELYESLPDKPDWITLEAIHEYEEQMQPRQPTNETCVKAEYKDGVCPDCGQQIPFDTKHGEACSHCGHVWNEPGDDQ